MYCFYQYCMVILNRNNVMDEPYQSFFDNYVPNDKNNYATLAFFCNNNKKILFTKYL